MRALPLPENGSNDDGLALQERLLPQRHRRTPTSDVGANRYVAKSREKATESPEERGISTILEEIGFSSRRPRPRLDVRKEESQYYDFLKTHYHSATSSNQSPRPLSHEKWVPVRRETRPHVNDKRSAEPHRESSVGKKEALFENETSDHEHHIPRCWENQTISQDKGLRGVLGKLEKMSHCSGNMYNRKKGEAEQYGENHGLETNLKDSASSVARSISTGERCPPTPKEKGGGSSRSISSVLRRLDNGARDQSGQHCHKDHKYPSKSLHHDSPPSVDDFERPHLKHPDGSFAAKYAFSTAGIPPLTQQTKHGQVTITPSGDIELHLLRMSPEHISISSDSGAITVKNKDRLVWHGRAEELPWRWISVYRYASRFVEVCRSKVSRISVELNGVRGRLLLNGEFEIYNAQTKTRARLTADRRNAKIYNSEDQLGWQGMIDKPPLRWRDLLRFAIDFYEKCVSIAPAFPERQGVDETHRFAPGIGWCSRIGKRIQFLFDDGVRLQVDLETREILYCGGKMEKSKWSLDQPNLPAYICDRLGHCQAFRDVE